MHSDSYVIKLIYVFYILILNISKKKLLGTQDKNEGYKIIFPAIYWFIYFFVMFIKI